MGEPTKARQPAQPYFALWQDRGITQAMAPNRPDFVFPPDAYTETDEALERIEVPRLPAPARFRFNMNEHYVVALDRGHLRIFSETSATGRDLPRLELVEAMDFPGGMNNYTAHDTDMAGRFPGSKGRATKGRSTGMSIDERLPMKREEGRRSARLIAAEVDAFFQSRPTATWDLAAAPALYNVVIEQLSPDTRRRLKRALSKDLVNQTPEDVKTQFAAAGG